MYLKLFMLELVVVEIMRPRGPPFSIINAEPISVNLQRIAIPVLVKRNGRIVVQISLANRNLYTQYWARELPVVIRPSLVKVIQMNDGHVPIMITQSNHHIVGSIWRRALAPQFLPFFNCCSWKQHPATASNVRVPSAIQVVAISFADENGLGRVITSTEAMNSIFIIYSSESSDTIYL